MACNQHPAPQLPRVARGNDHLFPLVVYRDGASAPLDPEGLQNLRLTLTAVDCGHAFTPAFRLQSGQIILELTKENTLEHGTGLYRLELAFDEPAEDYADGLRAVTLTQDLCRVTPSAPATSPAPATLRLALVPVLQGPRGEKGEKGDPGEQGRTRRTRTPWHARHGWCKRRRRTPRPPRTPRRPWPPRRTWRERRERRQGRQGRQGRQRRPRHRRRE